MFIESVICYKKISENIISFASNQHYKADYVLFPTNKMKT